MRRYHKIPVKGDKALEMRMVDVLDSLSDSAISFAYDSVPDTLQILSIEPAKGDPVITRPEPAQVYRVPSPAQRGQDIVDYLIAREERQAARFG